MNLRLAMKSPRLLICTLAAAGCLVAAQSESNALQAATPVAGSMHARHAGEERNDNHLKMKLVWCPPGKFMMGPQQSKPGQVEVTLTQGFWLGKYEATQHDYQQIMGKNPSYFSAQGEGKKDVEGKDTTRFPVDQVSWDDALEFCQKLTEQEYKAGRLPAGWGYTLPTRAQWEYACRAGTTTIYSFGDKLSAREANAVGTFGEYAADDVRLSPTTVAVGSYKANPWGLCDMHGNVGEWCRDWHARKLPGLDD